MRYSIGGEPTQDAVNSGVPRIDHKLLSKHCAASGNWFNLTAVVDTYTFMSSAPTGEVSEWLKEHAWKVCVR